MKKNDWDAIQYLKFEQERTQPAIDLCNRIKTKDTNQILDIGCGPGNSTNVLKKQFPKAKIFGIDSSLDMIERSRKSYPEITFEQIEITPSCKNIQTGYDIIFSNACLHWIPSHNELLPNLFAKLNLGGALAIQIPLTAQMPMYKILTAMAKAGKWANHIAGVSNFHTLTVEKYYDIITSLTSEFAIWETAYMQTMDSYSDMIEWYRGTGLRPYLDLIPKEQQNDFLLEIEKQLPAFCAIRGNGKILMPFPRLFMVLYNQG